MPKKPFRLALAQRICRPLPPLLVQRLRTVIYPQRQAFEDAYEFEVYAQTGSRFRHNTSDFHAYLFSVYGYYDWRNWAVALAIASPGDHIIEIGANIGTETIGFADIVGKKGRVSAFEPFPSNLESIRQNIKRNGFEQVKVYSFAVGAVCDTVEFALPPDTHASGVGYVIRDTSTNDIPKIKVQSVTLDSLQQELGPAQLIFMDVEGAEVDILRGAGEYINEYQPVIVLEAIRSHLRRAGYNFQRLHEELERHDYRAFRIGRFGLQDISLSSERNGNWLCLPQAQSALAHATNTMILQCGLLPCIRGLNPICELRGNHER